MGFPWEALGVPLGRPWSPWEPLGFIWAGLGRSLGLPWDALGSLGLLLLGSDCSCLVSVRFCSLWLPLGCFCLLLAAPGLLLAASAYLSLLLPAPR